MEARSARPVVPGRRRARAYRRSGEGALPRSREGDMQAPPTRRQVIRRRAVRSPRAPSGRTARRSRGPERDEPGQKRLSPLRESRRRGIDPPGITSANATLRSAPELDPSTGGIQLSVHDFEHFRQSDLGSQTRHRDSPHKRKASSRKYRFCRGPCRHSGWRQRSRRKA